MRMMWEKDWCGINHWQLIMLLWRPRVLQGLILGILYLCLLNIWDYTIHRSMEHKDANTIFNDGTL